MTQPEIIVNAVVEMDEAGFAAMRDPLLAMQQASRAEAGCQDYTFSTELDAPATVRITERWDDHASLLAHFATPHMAEFRAALAAHPPLGATSGFFEINEIPRPSPPATT